MTEQPTRDVVASVLHAGLGPRHDRELEPRLEAIATELYRQRLEDLTDDELDATIKAKTTDAGLSLEDALVVMERFMSMRSWKGAVLSVGMDALARRMCAARA